MACTENIARKVFFKYKVGVKVRKEAKIPLRREPDRPC